MPSFLRYQNRVGLLPRLLLVLLSCLPRLASAQIPYFGSTISVGTTQGGETSPGLTATDAQGNVYVTGSFAGTLAIGNQRLVSYQSHYDVFVAKLDAAGNYLWVAQAVSAKVYGLALDGDGNVYITGSSSSATTFGSLPITAPAGQSAGLYVAKLSSGGAWLWASGGGSESDYGIGLAVTSAGTATVVGGFAGGSATFGTIQVRGISSGSFSHDLFVARLDAAGHWLSAVGAGGVGNDAAHTVALDATGNAYVAGSFASPDLQLGGATLANPTPGSSAAFVAKLTAAGAWQWATAVGGTGATGSEIWGLALDPAGRTYVTGSYGGTTATFGGFTLPNQGPVPTHDAFVASLDAAGAWRWATAAGGTGMNTGVGIAVDEAGQATVTGSFLDPAMRFGATTLTNLSTTDGDLFVARLDAAGNWRWALSVDSPLEQAGQSVALAADGAALVAGAYWGQPTFGPTTLAGNNVFANVFLTRIYDNLPALASIVALAPASGTPGQVVALSGTGFVDVRAVLFNGTPAASFTVQSPTRLAATVPAGATAGPVSVRTGAGLASSTASFQPLALAAALFAQAAGLLVWPNPIAAASDTPLRLRLPDALLLPAAAVTRLELRNALGQLVRQARFSGSTTTLAVPGLAPGLYQLRLFPAGPGQPVLSRRLVVATE